MRSNDGHLVRSSAADRAKSHNMHVFTPSEAERWVMRVLIKEFARKASDARRVQIKAAYKSLLKTSMVEAPKAEIDVYPTISLKGPPGHGKSSIALGAVRRVCNALGMRLISDMDRLRAAREVPGANDMVVLTREMTGETSTLSTRGIFERHVDDTLGPLTKRIPSEDLAMARAAEYSVLLLDDLASAMEHVQNSLLGLMRTRRLDGESFDNFLVITTGNMGYEDGTSTMGGSAAIVGRSLTLYVEDTPAEFVNRYRGLFTAGADDGSTGGRDGWLLDFLCSHPDQFDADDRLLTDSRSPRPQPRTWESLLYMVSELMEEALDRHRTIATAATDRLVQSALFEVAAMNVGLHAAERYIAFFRLRNSDAETVAAEIFKSENPFKPTDAVARLRDLRSDVIFRSRYCDAVTRLASEAFTQGITSASAHGVLSEVYRRFICALEAGSGVTGEDPLPGPLKAKASWQLWVSISKPIKSFLWAGPGDEDGVMLLSDAVIAGVTHMVSLIKDAGLPARLIDEEAFEAHYRQPLTGHRDIDDSQ